MKKKNNKLYFVLKKVLFLQSEILTETLFEKVNNPRPM